MAIPILLVAGHLGAGKTTLINRLLRADHGLAIAAIVNDFGSIDIDAALLTSAADGLVSLKNGCICCSLQGDLLRTLAGIVRRNPAPDAIVIETSGISDPAEIIRGLMDPVVFKAASLDTVVTLVDAAQITDAPELMADRLWISQAGAADILLLTKSDLVGQSTTQDLVGALESRFAPRPVLSLGDDLPLELLFGQGLGESRQVPLLRPAALQLFQTTSWTATSPLSLARFQAALGLMSRKLLRAKGIIQFVEKPDQPLLFQLVGVRATLLTSPILAGEGLSAAIALIARHDEGELEDITAALDASVG
jgi:cobalamin biosynthesis protein CobW